MTRTPTVGLASDALLLEHIFPKSHKQHWEQSVIDDPRLPSMLNRLGNMCLLAGASSRAANRGWAQKLETYEKSRLRITNLITSERYANWNSAAIERRQSYMAKLAVSEWRWP
jgi:hypothetical protein